AQRLVAAGKMPRQRIFNRGARHSALSFQFSAGFMLNVEMVLSASQIERGHDRIWGAHAVPVRLGPRVQIAATRRNSSAIKVRDAEGGIASTRAACAPRKSVFTRLEIYISI